MSDSLSRSGVSSDPETYHSEISVILAPGQRDVAQDLHQKIDDLCRRISEGAEKTMKSWDKAILRDEFRDSARNLAEWLALRSTDLTELQEPLAQFGLSSLGRLDAHVKASLEAVLAGLALISGATTARFPDPSQMTEGHARILAARDMMFGPGAAAINGIEPPETRVMVTLPTEAATDPSVVRSLAHAGADCFRINCAHDGPEQWASMIATIRVVEAEIGRRIPVSMDLGGPKFRIETVSKSVERLFPGDRFTMCEHMEKGRKTDRPGIALSHPELIAALHPGMRVSIDDGKLWAEVVERRGSEIVLEVTQAPEKGMKLKAEKGVNLPGADLRVSALTDDDLAALDFVTAHADAVAFSFVQTVQDIEALTAAMEDRVPAGRPLPALVLKIETPSGLRNLPDLLVAAGGRLPVAVMIARGDLAVEIGFERLSEIQEEILWLCEAAHVPVIWATQVLETMVKTGQASRAEITDAAMAQRAECVMLNKGAHIVEAVSFLRGVLGRMDRHQTKKTARLGPLRLWRGRTNW